MRVLGVVWAGVRTDRYAETVAFFAAEYAAETPPAEPVPLPLGP